MPLMSLDELAYAEGQPSLYDGEIKSKDIHGEIKSKDIHGDPRAETAPPPSVKA